MRWVDGTEVRRRLNENQAESVPLRGPPLRDPHLWQVIFSGVDRGGVLVAPGAI